MRKFIDALCAIVVNQLKDIPTRQVTVTTMSDKDKNCLLCGSEMSATGTEVIRSEIVYTSSKSEQIEYTATTYACKDPEEPQFIKDNGTPALIFGSYVWNHCLHIYFTRLLEAIPEGMEKDYSNRAVKGVLYCNRLFEYESFYKEKDYFKWIYNRRLKGKKCH